jgi:hypothetical protein
MKGNIFWNVMPCSLVEIYQPFGGMYYKLAAFLFVLFLAYSLTLQVEA